MAEKQFLTKKGYEERVALLENLKVVRRKEVAQKLKEAREQGDLSENAEYDAAKDEQRDIETQITELEAILSNAEIIQDNDKSTDRVKMESVVKLHDIEYDEDIEYVIKGRDLIKGLPKAVTITANETVDAFEETTEHILGAIHNVLETAPPELVADIAVSGIVLTGGGSLIYGMDRIIKERTGIEAYVSEKALEAVALGAGMSVNLSDKKED